VQRGGERVFAAISCQSQRLERKGRQVRAHRHLHHRVATLVAATSVRGLELLAATGVRGLTLQCTRPYATSVRGLTLLVYEALRY
jgi:hypothetical protein